MFTSPSFCKIVSSMAALEGLIVRDRLETSARNKWLQMFFNHRRLSFMLFTSWNVTKTSKRDQTAPQPNAKAPSTQNVRFHISPEDEELQNLLRARGLGFCKCAFLTVRGTGNEERISEVLTNALERLDLSSLRHCRQISISLTQDPSIVNILRVLKDCCPGPLGLHIGVSCLDLKELIGLSTSTQNEFASSPDVVSLTYITMNPNGEEKNIVKAAQNLARCLPRLQRVYSNPNSRFPDYRMETEMTKILDQRRREKAQIEGKDGNDQLDEGRH